MRLAMRDNTEIFVIYLAHKLKALFDFAKSHPEFGLPQDKAKLGRELNKKLGTDRNWNKLFTRVASESIYKQEARSREDAERLHGGEKLTFAEHRAILEMYGLGWPHRTYWDGLTEREDRDPKRFERSLVSDGDKIVLRPLRRNQEFAWEELFTLEHEDVSGTRAHTGRISVSVVDQRMRGKIKDGDDQAPDELDQLLHGKFVGKMGFQEFRVHTESDETAQLETQCDAEVRTDTKPQVTIQRLIKKGRPSWLVRPSEDDDDRVISGSFNVADFDVTHVQPGGLVDIYATCARPHFSISDKLCPEIIDERHRVETILRYQKIAEAKLREAFDDSGTGGRRLTLARVSLKRED